VITTVERCPLNHPLEGDEIFELTGASGTSSLGVAAGALVRLFIPEGWQLVLGVPAIMAAFFAVLWTKGFGPEDRELFRLRKHEVRKLREAEDAAAARDQLGDDIV